MINKSKNKSKRNPLIKVICSFRDPETRNVLTDPVHVSNELDSHFASVGPMLASAMPQSKKDFPKYLPSSVPFSSFYLN